MDTTTALRDWLIGKPGFTMITDNSPDMIHFTINHSQGLGHKAFMQKMYTYKLYILSKGTNIGLKEYKVADYSPTW